MTQHDKAPALVERLKVVARCGTDSTMRHSAYAFMAQDPDGDYVTYSAYAALAEENRRLREALQPFAKAGELFPEAPGSVEFDQAIYKPAAGDEWSLCGDDLRRARAALSSTGEKV